MVNGKKNCIIINLPKNGPVKPKKGGREIVDKDNASNTYLQAHCPLQYRCKEWIKT